MKSSDYKPFLWVAVQNIFLILGGEKKVWKNNVWRNCNI